MRNYKRTILSLIALTAVVFISPLAVLASSDNNDSRKGNEVKVQNKVEAHTKLSLLGSNWFKSKSSNSKNVISTISEVNITSKKSTKAVITWNTDVRSNSFVWYSTSSNVDTTVKPNAKRNDRVSKHKIELNRLEPNTKYYIVIGSANKAGVVKSNEISFTTGSNVSVDTRIPVISDIKSVIDGIDAKITWRTNEPATSTVSYSVNSPVDLNSSSTVTVTSDELVKKHSLSLPNLTSETLYHFIIKSSDAEKNVAVSSEASFKTK